jgi:serine/threonine-protein kinase
MARDHGAWTCHLLRREAEELILPNLPAFRRGEYRPQDNEERLALLAGQLASCEFEGLPGVAARLYSNAFATEPKLADDVPAGARFRAARAAVLAGCGQGKDAEQVDDKERASRRQQALDWLRQDLDWLTKRPDTSMPLVRQRLQLWLSDPDFAGVRANDGLARLTAKEREEWMRLWSDVDALLQRVSGHERP